MLEKEDYEEFCYTCKREKFIPVGRILDKLDKHLAKKEFSEAERLLEYWVIEAEAIGDTAGKLTVLNEQVGFYRKTENEEKCIKCCDAALALASKLAENVTKGTTYLNVATAYKVFGQLDSALELYEKALAIYNANLDADDERMAGLYNNMALALTDKGDYARAREMFGRAINIMSAADDGGAEIAITYCNIADLIYLEKGFENGKQEIFDCLKKAKENLAGCLSPTAAYAAEKCESVFRYYGYGD